MNAANLPGTPGIYEQSLKLENGKELRYTLFIPSPFDEKQEKPLILGLHYGGTVTPWYGKGYLIILALPGLKELDGIILAPDCPTPNGWDNPKAESALLELVNTIKQNYNIDHKKILVTGFSLGGIGTWYMAARHPEIFSAAIPISAEIKPEIGKTIRIPVYAIHSSGDEIFPVKEVEESMQKLKARGMPVQLKIITGLSHYRTDSFVAPLHDAIPWIKQVWSNNVKK